MAKQESKVAAERQSRRESSTEQRGNAADVERTAQVDPLAQRLARASDAANPDAQAAFLHRATSGNLARAPQAILQLQRLYGNRYVQRLVQADRPSSATVMPTVQTKLTLGPVGDQYEQEADRVAKQVVNHIHQPMTQAARDARPIQRRNLSEDEHERLQLMPAIQRVPAKNGTEIDASIESAIQRARGGGQPLPDSIREPMEGAFGADFRGVKLHTDARADRLARSVHARAFTTGKDIFIKHGEPSLNSRMGNELLAHELTHTIQQSESAAIQRLSVTDTKWDKVKEVQVMQGGASGNVAELKDGNKSIIVKANQLNATEVLVANNLIHGLNIKNGKYSVNAPEVRLLSLEEIEKLKKISKEKMKDKSKARNFLIDLGKNDTLVMDKSTGNTFKDIVEKEKHSKKPWYSSERVVRDESPLVQLARFAGPLNVLGQAAAVDIFMGMGDRLTKSFNPENFLFDTKNKTFNFVDNTENIDSGYLTSKVIRDFTIQEVYDGFKSWAGHPMIQDLANDKFADIAGAIYDTMFGANGIPWDLKEPGKEEVEKLFTDNKTQMENYLSSGLKAGKKNLLKYLDNNLAAMVDGVSKTEQYEVCISIVARRKFLRGGITLQKAWNRGKQRAKNVIKNPQQDWIEVIRFFKRSEGLDVSIIDTFLSSSETINWSLINEYLDDVNRDDRLKAIQKAAKFDDKEMKELFG